MKQICEKLASIIHERVKRAGCDPVEAKRFSDEGRDNFPNPFDLTALDLDDLDETFPHMLWMLEEVVKFNIEAFKRCPPNDELSEKAHRWLGFVQGWMWSNDMVTINELREITSDASS